ncbi:MAG: hypothetical protein JSW15_03525 [Deltaproteobacteria bacterium]|nr:MAG: hypothetical protein JSW15_03525 [Deltaproteobacteria bacterium]
MAGDVTEYLIVDFIDDLEEAMYNAEKHDMADIDEGLNGLHDDFVDLGNVVDSDDKIMRLKTDIEQPLQELVEACQAGEAAKARDSIRTLREKVDGVKALWLKE